MPTWTTKTNNVTAHDADHINLLQTEKVDCDGVVPFDNTGLHILDTNASHDLIIAPGSDLVADRTLTITTGDANRTFTITGDSKVNQDVSTTGTPTFGTVTSSGAIKSGDSSAYQGTLATSMGDDTAISITPPAGTRCIFCLTGQVATESGLLALRVAASGNFCEILAAGAKVAATTGSLAGTTGADGVMTVSTHTDQKIYIENRLGGPRAISYMMIAANL